MAKRRDPSVGEMLFEILEFGFRYIPPWTSIPLALAGGTIIWRWWASKFPQYPPVQNMGIAFGAVFAIICLAAGFSAWLRQRKHKLLLQSNIDLSTAYQMSWRDFEHYIAEVYRQLGYRVEELGGDGRRRHRPAHAETHALRQLRSVT